MSFGFWLEWARRFRAQLFLIAALTMLSSIATLAVPWLAAQVLSAVIEGEADQALPVDLTRTLSVLVTVLITLTALTITATFASQMASTRILTELRKRIYAHVQMLPLAFHDDSRKGDVLALTSYEVSNLSDFLAETIANAPAMVLTALGAIVILFWIDPAMALIVPLLVPAFYIMTKLAGRRLRAISGKVRAAEVELIAVAERDLEMLPAIKAFATEAQRRAEFDAAAERSRDLAVDQARLNAVIGPLVTLVAALAAIAVLVISSGQLSGEQSSPSELFAFLLYAALLTRPVGGLANMYGAYQMARGTLARLEAVLALKAEPGYQTGRKIDRAEGAIKFEKVDFAYTDRPPVFERLELAIAAGETIALTGGNGVGKSTLIRLLLRYYEPNSGVISLDGCDIAQLDLQELRRQFGYVPQRPLLFNGTLRDNVVFGQEIQADDNATLRALELAQASSFVERLPQGLDTEIGDNGVRLSGGQQQRIALARALYRDPPIYILDEATSMFDLESEASFVETCVESLKGRTVLIITHRPASLALADRIVEITPDGVRAKTA